MIDRDRAEHCCSKQRSESDGATAVNVAKIKRLPRFIWKFFVDKNRSTAIASILRFVSEFLQSISLAIEFLQSILVRRRVIAIELLQSSFCNRS